MLICNSCTVYIRYTHSYLEVLNSNDWFYILYFSVLSSDVRQDWVNVAMYLNNQNTTENTNITRKKIIFTFCTQNEYYISIACCACRVLRKLGIMHVRNVSSQISLCSSHRLIRDENFRLNMIFGMKGLPLNEKNNIKADCTG